MFVFVLCVCCLRACTRLCVRRVVQQQDETPGSSRDEEQAGPSRRKRQPSMSETMPLYTLCKEDLESMDKEVRAARSAPRTHCKDRLKAAQKLAGKSEGLCTPVPSRTN